MRTESKFVLFFIFALLITTNLDVFGAEQSTRELGFVNKYVIKVDEQSFDITIVANFLVHPPIFSGDDITLQFNVETGLEKENIAEVVIPRELIDGEFTVLLDGKEISYKSSSTNKTIVLSIIFDGKGKHVIDIIATHYLEIAPDKSNDGGCLIATATFGSELSPQVQFLREIRDGKVMTTQSGAAFMNGFNQFYYSFSPVVADYVRENSIFKDVVKLTLTPLLTSLTLLQYVDIDSEHEMLGYGIGVILLNIGIYFVGPAILIMKIRKRVNTEKSDERYA